MTRHQGSPGGARWSVPDPAWSQVTPCARPCSALSPWKTTSLVSESGTELAWTTSALLHPLSLLISLFLPVSLSHVSFSLSYLSLSSISVSITPSLSVPASLPLSLP